MKKKILVSVVATSLLIGSVFGGTLAYLMDTTDEVENVFTVGNIDITLEESQDLDLKMVPGNPITKDPKVTVEKDSEKCWLFVKVDKSSNLDTFIDYDINSAVWTRLQLANDDEVYYRVVESSTSDQEFEILTNNMVTTRYTVEKADMDGLALTDAEQPSLTFTAYAIQYENFSTAADAWNKLNE